MYACMYDLYQCFIDLTKAFDTVNREALWTILMKLGCTEKFTGLIRSLHDGMEAWICFNGDLSEPIPVENGVKQGDLLAPTLFAIFFAVVLESTSGIEHLVSYTTSGGSKLSPKPPYRSSETSFMQMTVIL